MVQPLAKLAEYSKGYYDEEVYFNSPMHFIPSLNDHAILEEIRKSDPIYLLSGSGE